MRLNGNNFIWKKPQLYSKNRLFFMHSLFLHLKSIFFCMFNFFSDCNVSSITLYIRIVNSLEKWIETIKHWKIWWYTFCTLLSASHTSPFHKMVDNGCCDKYDISDTFFHLQESFWSYGMEPACIQYLHPACKHSSLLP